MKNHIENIKILRLPNFYIREPREACKYWFFQPNIVFNLHFWRSGRDSNPRGIAPKLISSQPRYDHFDTAAYYISNALPTHKKRGHHIENRRSFKIPVFARLFTKPSPTASYGFKSALVQPLRCCYLHFSPFRNRRYYTTPFLFSQVDKRDFSSFLFADRIYKRKTIRAYSSDQRAS